jgi:hypothetical protein
MIVLDLDSVEVVPLNLEQGHAPNRVSRGPADRMDHSFARISCDATFCTSREDATTAGFGGEVKITEEVVEAGFGTSINMGLGAPMLIGC